MMPLASRTSQALVDIAILSLAYWFAFLLRFEGDLPKSMFKVLIISWPYVVGLKYLLMVRYGITKFSWRFIGLREINRIFMCLLGVSLGLVALRLLTGAFVAIYPYMIYALVPLGVIAIDFILSFMGVSGVRTVRRLIAERARTKKHQAEGGTQQVPTLLIGAGEAGLLVAKEIASHPALGISAVGFVDDDSHKLGTTVHGIHVIGMTAQIPALIEQTGAKQAIITITNAPGSSIRRITEICKSVGIVPKIIPGVHELLDGKLNLSRLREVSVEDLLRRAPVELETPLVESFLTGKRVMVTGAGGSIGSELCRQVARFKPAVLLLVERSEFHLFSIHMELSNDHPNLMIKPLICDIADESRVSQVFQLHRPEVIFHAAAHKHVPMMELNPGEAIKNNSFGTKIVAQAADRYEADAFVLISTDKAVNPTSIMGATKRVAEMFIQALSQRSSTKFVAVRFGNVLGSTGSVIPIFKQQISKGGPVTITHPEMRRYFMTIPEASQLVMQAAAMGKGGEIFVLDMGEAVKIKDLAYDLIRMSGLEPERDIEVVYSGVRPGEKLFEELGFDSEKMNKTRHPQIYVGKLSQISWTDMDQKLNELKPFCEIQQRAAVRAALGRVVPEMQDDAKTNDNHTAQAINSDAAQVINNSSPTLSTPNGVSIH